MSCLHVVMPTGSAIDAAPFGVEDFSQFLAPEPANSRMAYRWDRRLAASVTVLLLGLKGTAAQVVEADGGFYVVRLP